MNPYNEKIFLLELNLPNENEKTPKNEWLTFKLHGFASICPSVPLSHVKLNSSTNLKKSPEIWIPKNQDTPNLHL